MEVDAETRGSLHVLETDAVGLADFGGTTCLQEHGVEAESGDNACTDIDNPPVVEDQNHVVHRDVARDEKQNGNYKYVACTDTEGEGDGIAEAIVYTGLNLREERRSEAEKQRQRDTA